MNANREQPATLEVPANLSYSQANTLIEDPGRYYLERVQRVPNRPSWASVGGSAAHSATEELDRRLMEGGEHIADLSDIADIFHSHMRLATEDQETRSGFERTEFRATGRASKEFPDKENHLWWGKNGPGFVKSWVGFRDAIPYQIAELDYLDVDTGEVVTKLGIETEVRFNLPDLPEEVTVHGFIDRVFVRTLDDGSREFYVVDLKFGSREPVSHEQLLTYREGLIQCFGIDPKWGGYWMGRHARSTTAADLHATSRDQIAYNYRMAHDQRMRGDFRYHPSNLCGSCGVREYCPIVGGEFADTIQQPWEIRSPISLRPPKADV